MDDGGEIADFVIDRRRTRSVPAAPAPVVGDDLEVAREYIDGPLQRPHRARTQCGVDPHQPRSGAGLRDVHAVAVDIDASLDPRYFCTHEYMCTLEFMFTATLSVSDRKRQAILECATQSFLRVGFTGTSLDDVATAANVSKVTIYRHFSSKESLFRAVIERVIAQRTEGGPPLDSDVGAAKLRAAMIASATDLVETVRDPVVIGLRRVLIAEQPRHPSLAAAWRSAAVVASIEELAVYFGALQERGLLRRFETTAVARQFLWMLVGDALDASLFDPASPAPPAHESAEIAVDTLLAAFGRAPAGRAGASPAAAPRARR
ncbi:TetR/AcrR family transcriptional regulator [Microbacterium hibisci]|uniref:TetR/AcrR family transcriptional regulator n=1 Tax=Microbacterium hibisci TaxID=2036000 RepID=UPI0027DA7B5D|nr:TetR/AcrR family transcriptional regulator [Microbacterium hibisci]